MNIRQIFNVLLGGWWIVALTVALATCITYLINHGKDDMLKARSTLLIDFQQPDSTSTANLAPQLQEGYLATQIEIISSPKVAKNVIDRTNMIKGRQYWSQFEEDTDTVKGLIKIAIGHVKAFIDSLLGNEEIEDIPISELQDEALVGYLTSQLNVNPRDNTRIIDIVYQSRNPEFAIEMANAFADAYVKTNLELNTATARRNAEWMNEQLAELRAKLDAAQRRLTDYEMKTGILANDGRAGIEITHLSELTEQLAIAEAEAEFEDNKLQQLMSLQQRGADLNSVSEVMTNSFLQSLKSDLRSKEGQLAELSTEIGRNHPDYISVEAEIASLKDKMQSEIDIITNGIRNQAALAKAKVVALRKAQTIQKNKLLQGKETSSDLPALIREIENAQASYELALNRYEQYNLQSRVTQTNAAVLNYAQKANRSRIPAMARNLTLSAILGFVLGCGLVLLLEIRRPLVRGENDLTALEIDYLGKINAG